MTNLAGNDMQAVLDAFEDVGDDTPTCFIAYTIKGQGLPFAGHKDNHSGLMTLEQMAGFKKGMGIEDGQEWDKFAGLTVPPAEFEAFLEDAPFNAEGRRRTEAPAIAIPAALPRPTDKESSTQAGFGKILNAIAGEDSELSRRIVTTSPDVSVSTNLGAWINRRGLFGHTEAEDVFRELKVVSAQLWRKTPRGQHIELGIAENNLFIQLAALGLEPRDLRHAPAADRHAVRPVHRARPRCAELRLLPGCAVHDRRHAVGRDARARRAARIRASTRR